MAGRGNQSYENPAHVRRVWGAAAVGLNISVYCRNQPSSIPLRRKETAIPGEVELSEGKYEESNLSRNRKSTCCIMLVRS